jgi:hypothetical protein
MIRKSFFLGGIFLPLVVAACSSSSGTTGLGDDTSDDASTEHDASPKPESDASATATSTADANAPPPADSGASCAHVPSATDTVYYDTSGLPHLDGASSAACDLHSHVACLTILAPIKARCISSSSQCTAQEVQFACLQKSDCSGGKLCCADNNSSSSGFATACVAPGSDGQCPQATIGPVKGSLQFCQTDCECANKQKCTPQHCAQSGVGGQNADLTICGVQSGSGYSCTAK